MSIRCVYRAPFRALRTIRTALLISVMHSWEFYDEFFWLKSTIKYETMRKILQVMWRIRFRQKLLSRIERKNLETRFKQNNFALMCTAVHKFMRKAILHNHKLIRLRFWDFLPRKNPHLDWKNERKTEFESQTNLQFLIW